RPNAPTSRGWCWPACRWVHSSRVVRSGSFVESNPHAPIPTTGSDNLRGPAMNTRTTFIVLLLAIALAGYFILFELKTDKRTDVPVNAVGQPVFDTQPISAAAIHTITIQKPGKPAAVLERDSDRPAGW